MGNQQRLILVTNDDSIYSKGIETLVNAVRYLGKVVVVAPDSPQSGMGHAITIHDPIRLEKRELFGPDVDAYTCSGTPVDCVKLAVDKVLHRKPDICVSGINHGSNASINVIYSGTMSAALEAAIEGVPSIGFSLLDFNADADFSAAGKYAHQLTEAILEDKAIEPNTVLNVNIPKLSFDEIKGVKVCRQAMASWKESFDERTDPTGKPYYWMKGEFHNPDLKEDTDIWALENNYVSVVPVMFDMTRYNQMKRLSKQFQ